MRPSTWLAIAALLIIVIGVSIASAYAASLRVCGTGICVEVGPGVYQVSVIDSAPDPQEPMPPDPQEPEPTPEPPDPQEPEEPPPSDDPYTFLGAVTGIDNFVDYFMPYIDSPAAGWGMITAMCGDVGSWAREIVVPYVDETPVDIRANKYEAKCFHIKGEPGPNGELPRVNIASTHGYRGALRHGGLFVENIRAGAIGVPNDQYFLVLRNVHLSGWGNHALITSGGNKHMYVEISAGSHFAGGNANHAAYIDNVAFAYVADSVFESPGQGHALRSVAQRSIIERVKACNIQCDGTITNDKKGRQRIGMAPLEVYANGAHIVRDVEVVYYRKPNRTPHAMTLRNREGINTVDRYWDGVSDHYTPLVWGTPHYNDPQTWTFPTLETLFEDIGVTCYGAPCDAIHVSSTYPYMHDSPKARLLAWWKLNKFPDWESLIAHAHQSWHGTLNLMTPEYRAKKLEDGGRGLPNKVPLPVPEGWQQKATVTLKNVTGNFVNLVRPTGPSGWCAGEMSGGTCQNYEYYNKAEVVVDGDEPQPNDPNDQPTDPPPNPDQPTDPIPDPNGGWADSLLPYIPGPGQFALIPNTALTPHLLRSTQDDQAVCSYLRCDRSHIALIDWVGMGFDYKNGCAWFVAMGGHADLGANSVYRFCVGDMTWDRVHDYDAPDPFPGPDENGDGTSDCVRPKNGPFGAHDWDGQVFAAGKTFKFRTSGYSPKGCSGGSLGPYNVWAWSNGWEDLGIPEFAFPKTAYDPARDLVYLTAQKGLGQGDKIWEFNPHTYEFKVVGGVWNGKGGSAAFDPVSRRFCVATRGDGLHCWHVSLDGKWSSHIQPITKHDSDLLPALVNGGIAVSGDTIVVWDGSRAIQCDETCEAFDSGVGGVRVLGKFVAVPGLDGVFLGIADNDGWVVYRAK